MPCTVWQFKGAGSHLISTAEFKVEENYEKHFFSWFKEQVISSIGADQWKIKKWKPLFESLGSFWNSMHLFMRSSVPLLIPCTEHQYLKMA